MRLRPHVFSMLLFAALLVFAAPVALAYDGGQPMGGEVSFHLGVFEPKGDSDLWHENEDLFTLDNTDYDNVIVGMAYSSRINPFLDIMVGNEYYNSGEVDSEYRNFFFGNGDLIRHESRLQLFPLEVTLKILPFGRAIGRGRHGREVLRPVIPYIGFGVGGLLWDYEEDGDFVDTTGGSPVVYRGDFKARGLAATCHALVGIEVQINPQFALQFDGKYRWAKDSLGSDFSGFDDFDLSGASLNAGMAFRF